MFVAAPLLAIVVLAADAPATATDEPLLRGRLELPVTWRSASVKPDIGPAARYGTDTPYAGVGLDVTVAPFHGLRRLRWIAPTEFDLELSQRFASVATSSTGGSFSAREQRVSLDVLYPVKIQSLTLAGRIGYGLHRFAIDNDPLPPSVRHGIRVGVDATQRLPLSLLGEAFARAFPTMGPGPEERAAFGADGGGWGFQVGLALGRPIYGGLGARVGYDFVHFSDSYSGAGSRSVGGSGEASYHCVSLGLTFAM